MAGAASRAGLGVSLDALLIIVLTTRFKIEKTLTIGDKVHVIVELIDKEAQFELSDDTFLGGIPIEKWLDIPRALDIDGRQRHDIFVFALKNKSDKTKIDDLDEAELS